MKPPPLPYPPLWADEETMAALLCLGASTFRSYVKRGLLPEGVLIGSSRRWNVGNVSKTLDKLHEVPDDPIMARIRRTAKELRDGEKKKDKHHVS